MNRFYLETVDMAKHFGLYPVKNQEEYKGNAHRMTWVCEKGYLYYLNRRVLKNNKAKGKNKFSIFHVYNKYSGHNIRVKMYNDFKLYSICDTEYKNCNTKFDFVDSDGFMYHLSAENILYKNDVDNFSKFKFNKYKRYNINLVINKYNLILSKDSDISRFDNIITAFNTKTFFKYEMTLSNLIRNTSVINWTARNKYALYNIKILAHRKFGLTLISTAYHGALHYLVFKDKFGFYYKKVPSSILDISTDYGLRFETEGILGKYNILKFFCEDQQLFLTRDNDFSLNGQFRDFVDIYGNVFTINTTIRISSGKYDHYYTMYDAKYRRNIDYEEINSELKSRGYEIIKSSYNGVTKNAVIRDINCGYLYESKPFNIKYRDPFKFHIYNKYTMYNLNLYFKNNGFDVNVISKEYNGSSTKVKIKCSECGVDYKTRFGDLVRQVFPSLCHSCSDIKRISYYSIRCVNEYNTEELMDRSSGVYLFNIIYNSSSYLKIGISKSPRERSLMIINELNDYFEDVDIDILLTKEVSLYDAIYLEHYLHDYFSSYSYKPKEYFAGYTECFKNITPEQVQLQISHFLSNKQQIISEQINSITPD